MIKTTNNQCSELVTNKIEFKANNIFSEYIKEDKLYIVYSYGYHFPMYVKYKNTWYENSDKYSVTTSKQQSQSRPNAKTKKRNTSELKNIINNISRGVK
jgi:hypothetical protein